MCRAEGILGILIPNPIMICSKSLCKGPARSGVKFSLHIDTAVLRIIHAVL